MYCIYQSDACPYRKSERLLQGCPINLPRDTLELLGVCYFDWLDELLNTLLFFLINGSLVFNVFRSLFSLMMLVRGRRVDRASLLPAELVVGALSRYTKVRNPWKVI